MHDLDELKRQWDQAKSRRVQAVEAEATAQERYAKAACAKLRADLDAQGFTEGTKVRVRRMFLGEPQLSSVVAIGAVEWHGFLGPFLTFRKIKKDGTPSKVRSPLTFSPSGLSTLELVSDGGAQ